MFKSNKIQEQSQIILVVQASIFLSQLININISVASPYYFMQLNQSYDSSNPNSYQSSDHHLFYNNNTNFTQGRGLRTFGNPHRRAQIILSIALVAFTTLWVQISVQRHGPFIRTAQCFFNELVLQHDSQDIYQGTDVIFWRNGETYDFSEMQGIFSRLATTVQALETNSLFHIADNVTYRQDERYAIEMMTIYRYDIPQRYHEYLTYNFTIDQMSEVFNSTLLNRTFYEHLWKISISILVPLQYRSDVVNMRLYMTVQIYSSMLMQYKMDIDIVDQDLNQVNSQSPFSEDNLGVRKLPDPHDLELDTPYLNWLCLILYMVLFLLQYRFILHKNHYLNELIEVKLKEENQIEQLLKKVDDKQKRPSQEHLISFGIELMELKQPQIMSAQQKHQHKFKLSIAAKLQKIGYYYILQLAISLIAFFGFFNNHNGIVCFLSWCKIIVYLAQTKNRLMFGFLFQETIPTYLRIQLNIILFITAFVLFNMLVLNITKKFQDLELGYYQYFFNYFQYGIYQNWSFVFTPFGMLAQFFYFVQIMLLLYIGNNILISILANQVSKNSYLTSVEDMIDELKMKCPACGTDFQSKKKGKTYKMRKEMLVSKIVRDLEFERIRASYDTQHESQYNIMIRSPNLSPYFPAKNQKNKNNQQFLSPNLKNKNLKDRLKEINKRMQEEENTISKIQAFEQLKNKVEGSKKVHIELSDPSLESEYKNKLHKKIRMKLQMLFQKIDKFKQIGKEGTPKSGPLNFKQREKDAQLSALNLILQKVNNLQKHISSNQK